MGWLTWGISLLLGLNAGFNYVGIGAAYGNKDTRVPWVFFSIVTAISVCSFSSGGMTGVRIGQDISSPTPAIIGTAILICIGGWTIVQALVARHDESLTTQLDSFGFNEMMFIIASQSMANLSMGLCAGLLRLNILVSSICVGTLSFLLLLLPIYLTKHCMFARFSKSLPVVCGLLLMCVGLFR